MKRSKPELVAAATEVLNSESFGQAVEAMVTKAVEMACGASRVDLDGVDAVTYEPVEETWICTLPQGHDGAHEDHRDPEGSIVRWTEEPDRSTPRVDRFIDESAHDYLLRVERTLPGGEYDEWIGSDEGQQALKDAARESDEARKAEISAERKAERERRAEMAKQQKATTGSGPVEKVATQEPTTKPKVVKPAVKPIENKPLKLGTKAIVVDGKRVYPILHRDGSVADHQTDNYIWKCPTCQRRLRAELCAGRANANGQLEAHDVVKAPAGYRVADRVVKEA